VRTLAGNATTVTMYNKLFTKILDSSIWLEDAPTRIVWITLIAAMDQDGYAHFSALENLAIRARVSVEQAQKAIECFTAPDPNSGNPDNEGRRVERVPGGFFILNAEHHRQMMNRTIEREQTRIRVARHRAKNVTPDTVTPPLPNVTSVCVSSSISESIYLAYPKHVGKKAALKAIDAALKVKSSEFLLERSKAFSEAVKLWPAADHQFIPYPATWFNAGRYDDDPSEWERTATTHGNTKRAGWL
jgi:hypothetical protein